MRMAVIGLVELAEATKWLGDATVDPFAGEVTVTPANAATLMARAAIAVLIIFFISQISWGRACDGLRVGVHQLCLYSRLGLIVFG
jgi:hypothetical protein